MSKFPGGIFSKARGKVAGLVFSAARTREGKLMTARQLVIPANPQTPAQQSNRGIFDYTQASVRQFGPGIYRQGWNRAVEDLPGYQSLISLIRRSYNLAFAPDTWRASSPNPDTLLGDLHFPATHDFNLNLGTAELEVTWSTELGENGQADDTAIVLVTQAQVDAASSINWIQSMESVNRSVGAIDVDVNFDGYEFGTYAVLYFVNFENAEGFQRSIATWDFALEV